MNPPVPPRPPSQPQMLSSVPPPPPLPPLPPGYRPQESNNNSYFSPPHFEDPLAAPKPHRLDPSIPANMARTLDDQASNSYQQQDYRRLSPMPPPPPPPGMNPSPGFAMPSPNMNPAPGQYSPNPQGWSPWVGQSSSSNNYSSSPPREFSPLATPVPYSVPTPQPEGLSQQMASLTFSTPPQPTPPQHPRHQSTYGPPRKSPSPPRTDDSLTKVLPTIAQLSAASQSIQGPSQGPVAKLNWCRDVIFLANRTQQGASAASTDSPTGPINITDPQLSRLIQIAVPIILQLASPNPPVTPLPIHTAEAMYLRATFASSGSYPEHIPRNPRTAFRDFEAAARAGNHASWFRLGRDYENFNDFNHARDCFERGSKHGVESCIYRLAMANLMGQLGLPANVNAAIPLLQRAASLSSVEVPQPAYVYALLLLSEFSHVNLPTSVFIPFIPSGSTVETEAKKYLEKAAYLHFPAAQYKLGHAYEFAQPPFPFDPLMSVQYYSLASQHGEMEADMALSKWFLCGSEGSFDKDETLALTFAEKAANKGLPTAEFAMGYYAEVGVGGPKNLEAALKWYTKASAHDNADAKERLEALQKSSAAALSRQEHDSITEAKLMRKRTQAKQRSDSRRGTMPAPQPTQETQQQGRRVIEHIRKNSLAYRPEAGPSQAPQYQQNRPSQMSGAPSMPSMPEHPSTPPAHSGSPHMSAAAIPQARPRPQKQQQQYPAQNRYTLSDPGAGSAPPPSSRPPQQNPPSQFRPPGQRKQSGGPGGGSPVPSGPAPSTPPAQHQPPKKTGPATFAEMGIQGGKAEDKECVIM